MNVYFIRNSSEHIKIGVSNDPVKRLATLQTSNHNKLELLYTVTCGSREEAFSLEKSLHALFSSYRAFGEWFDVPEGWISLIPSEITLIEHCKGGTPDYYLVGSGQGSIDFLEEFAQSTAPAQWLLLQIKRGIAFSNNFSPVVSVQAKTETEKTYLKKGYSELVKKDLVIRVSRGMYMINPAALIPADYTTYKKVWDTAVKENKIP
jgi:hypothetical protein